MGCRQVVERIILKALALCRSWMRASRDASEPIDAAASTREPGPSHSTLPSLFLCRKHVEPAPVKWTVLMAPEVCSPTAETPATLALAKRSIATLDLIFLPRQGLRREQGLFHADDGRSRLDHILHALTFSMPSPSQCPHLLNALTFSSRCFFGSAPPPPAPKPKPKPTSADTEDAERRRKEKEAYERQKAELEREEAEERKKKEEKERKKREAEETRRKEQEAAEAEKKKQEAEAEKERRRQEAAEAAEAAVEASDPAAAASAEEEVESDEREAPSSVPASSPPAEDADKPKTHRCKAIAPYVAKSDEEISFDKDDVVFVITHDLSTKVLRGVCKGKNGCFPGHFVEDTATGQRCGDPSLHFKMGVKCRALGNYTAQAPGELSFKRDEVLFISVLNNDRMLKAVCNGQVGLVPRSYVVDVAEDTATSDSAPAAGDGNTAAVPVARCCAIRPHFSNRQGWLDFDIGDIVMVPKKVEGKKTWQGVFQGNVGKLRADFVVDTAEIAPDMLEEMVAQARAAREQQRRASQPRAAPAAAAPAPAADPFAANVSTPVADPFAATTDPFAAAADPFSPSAMKSSPVAGGTPGSTTSQRSTSGRRSTNRPHGGANNAILGSLNAAAFENLEAAPSAPVKAHATPSALERTSSRKAAPQPQAETDAFAVSDPTPAAAAEPTSQFDDAFAPAEGNAPPASDNAATAAGFGNDDFDPAGLEAFDAALDDIDVEGAVAFDDGVDDTTDASAGATAADKKAQKAEAKRMKEEEKRRQKEAKQQAKLERKNSKGN
ncbi:uncharacterized protein MONBRDRAFT_8311 [Monosiga brevicollis MX1]|uniref:SH3 domain-containing protein n=1 Tax=Monosiga brevicollis TaxID=81824 RepID=A9UZP4_MONBE|nr:uncharacterized protein MONBRDRAFT_8311 [Monosiga brevicollis MX1]EDQ89267.1 predicted protein [Monosiga brevicollis MX1]|eukprot:XP_001745843.1 hypothetical protein [Monosiga brevicollis MX1]